MNPSEQAIRDHDAVIARFVALCSADERIVAAFLGGSHARGEADEFSDLDLCLITTDEAYGEVVSGRRAIIEQLGEPLFLEDFGLEGIVFFILADGTEAELFFRRASALDEIRDVGPYRTLLDKEGILAGAEFPMREPDRAEQVEALRHLVYWFWHDLSHLIAALGRGQVWWAHGQLEALRAYCVNLIRIDENVEAQEEAYEKLDQGDPDGATLNSADELRSDGEKRDASGGRRDRELLPEACPRLVASAYGVPYPVGLDRMMSDRLDTHARDGR